MTDRKEFWLVVSAIMCLTTLVSWVGQWIPMVGPWGTLIIAIGFLYVPMEVLERRGSQLKDFGIWRGDVKQGLKQCLVVSLVVLIPYSFCFHFWQTEVVGQKPSFEIRHLKDWPLEFEANPQQAPLNDTVKISLNRDYGAVQWHFDTGSSDHLKIILHSEARIVTNAPKKAVNQDQIKVDDRSIYRTQIQSSNEKGQVQFLTQSEAMEIKVLQNEQPLDGAKILDGYSQTIGKNPVKTQRDFWWLIHFILGQLILVALPEEVFYRGYVQTRLEQRFRKRSKVFGVQVSWPALLLTSAIFAVGHLLTIPHPARLAVFFPSLLFGWMRSATNSVFSAICFHAICNIFAQVAFQFYGG